MRKIICSVLNTLCKPLKLTVLKRKDHNALILERNVLQRLYRARASVTLKEDDTATECIVFSKDRAPQLHALLGSLLDNVTPLPLIHVLYKSSNSLHQQVYDEVTALFSSRQIHFTKQSTDNSFKQDLVAILDNVRAGKVFFLVDDVLFIEGMDFNDFLSLDLRKFVPSLRLGANLKDCYTLQKAQALPEWESGVAGEKMLVWQWRHGELDWQYPLSVDGHIFSTEEIRIITEALHFSAPNTYEDALQVFREIFGDRYGVCYQKSVIVNIPCNKVQTENKNISGEVHHNYLLEQWLKGLQINYRKLYGYKNVSAHEEIDFEFTKRE